MTTLAPSSDLPKNALTSSEIDAAAEVLGRGVTAVLTGAGVSTDSGIPDYRGEGAPVRNPMTFQQFLSAASFRQRYWAGSHLGWRRFDSAQPNPGHETLARLEAAGKTNGIITQNVDGLHLRAGSQRVVDLHGSGDRVICLTCGQTFARASVSERIERANPWLDAEQNVIINPDGDAEVQDIEQFIVPSCTVCGGVLKPDVVFFGEFVPIEKFAEATALVRAADALLIAGSSLVVNSGIRLLQQAKRRKIPIVIINRGVTKGDKAAQIKLDSGTTETLAAIAQLLGV
jgi:NAD-dependent SIR2 family protein deacetylase